MRPFLPLHRDRRFGPRHVWLAAVGTLAVAWKHAVAPLRQARGGCAS